jgi:hypothetical protein
MAQFRQTMQLPTSGTSSYIQQGSYTTGATYAPATGAAYGSTYGTTYASGSLQSGYVGGAYASAVHPTTYATNVAHPVVTQQYLQGTQSTVQPVTVAATQQIPTHFQASLSCLTMAVISF